VRYPRYLDTYRRYLRDDTIIIIIKYDTIRYDTIGEITWTRKLSIELYLAHVARKRNQNNQRQCPFNTVQAKIREVSPEGIRVTMEERICERDEF